MKNKSTQNSLIYTGAVLLFFTLLTHLTLSQPDGGIFSSIGILIVSLFQLVIFVIGLAIGIALCIAVMLCVFIAAAYLVNTSLGKEIAQKTKAAALNQVWWMLSIIAPGKFGMLQPTAGYAGMVTAPISLEPVSVNAATVRPIPAIDHTGNKAEQPAVNEHMVEVLRKMEDRLKAIETSVQSIESKSAQFVHTKQLEAMGAAVRETDERSREALDTRINPMQEQLKHISKQNEELSEASKKLGDIVLRIVTLEQKTTKLAELPQQVTELRDEVTSKYEIIPQQVADLRGEVQQQIDALKQKPAAKGRPRKKGPAPQQS